MAVVGNRRHSTRHIEAQFACHLIYNDEQRAEHAECLQRVGPHQCFNASAPRVEPDEHEQHRHREPERHSPRVEHESLQDDAHYVEASCCPRHLRQQEKPCARLVGLCAQSLAEEGIDRGEVQPIEHRQQHQRHEQIARNETQTHLQVGHILREHHSRHRDESHARDRCPDHAPCHHVPRTAPLAAIEHIVRRTPSRQSAQQHQHGQIAQNHQ